MTGLGCGCRGNLVVCQSGLPGFGEGTLYEMGRPSVLAAEMKLAVIFLLLSESKSDVSFSPQ